jgi:amidase/aspartyl-tRNA(Asn)/glutamyl-tRNA(Gln) amidotransferase subunit A
MFDISQYVNAYSNGALEPTQVIADHMQYAKAVSEEVNAISVVNPFAMKQAELSETRYKKGKRIGPLDGVPVVVKDSYHVKGLPRWHGSAIHDGDPVSSFSSEPVQRLEEAGAIIIAKTTMPDMGMLGSGISSQFGIVRNPWNTSCSPGGSSSGTGASLSCGLAALGLGTDIAGSVRLPAGQCGLAGIKPTQGRIAYSPASVMRSAGVLARSVSDVIEGLKVVGCQSESDPWCLPGAFEPRPVEQILDGVVKVGLVLDMGYGTALDPAVEQAVRQAASRLESAGCYVETVGLHLNDADFDNADRVFKAHAIAEIRASRHPDAVLESVADWVGDDEKLLMADYEDAMNDLLGTVHVIYERTSAYDYLVCPVIPVIGFPANSPGPDDEGELLHHTQYTAWFNQTCQPAAVYRETVDSSSHLPIGVQIVGRRFDDAGVLALAQMLENTRSQVDAFPAYEGVPEYEI